MDSGVFVVLFVIVAAAAVGIGILGHLAAKKRREGMAALAYARGWTYTERDDRWHDRFQGSPFGLGHTRRSTNVLQGSYDGRPFVAFDFVYHTTQVQTTGKTTTTRQVPHHFGIVALDMGTAFPPLEVTPEGFVGRFIGRLTDSDIELESEAFNRAFTVTCPDRKFASDVLHPRMMEVLLQYPESAFRFERTWILDVESGTVPLESIVPRLQRVDTVVDQIPEFVWREVRG
ncbi:DUF3137 domain-containing protein [Nocardioides sp.]|uniref:DUF3137 domain-containing protein n=1 Tax=Nocardioides sp. TaxID=35761 RepID=UPI002ED1C172